MRRSVNASRQRFTGPMGAIRRLRITLVLPLCMALAGCGYRLDTPHLPNNASRLAVAAIRNETATGELDIRLQQFLRSRLLRHTSFDLVALDRGDLSLETVLVELKITRGRNLASTNVSSIVYELKGDASLFDRRSGAYYFLRTPVAVVSRLDFDAPVVETPAIRDEGLTGVLEKFAQRLEALVLLSF
jgi:hypothetical protein